MYAELDKPGKNCAWSFSVHVALLHVTLPHLSWPGSPSYQHTVGWRRPGPEAPYSAPAASEQRAAQRIAMGSQCTWGTWGQVHTCCGPSRGSCQLARRNGRRDGSRSQRIAGQVQSKSRGKRTSWGNGCNGIQGRGNKYTLHTSTPRKVRTWTKCILHSTCSDAKMQLKVSSSFYTLKVYCAPNIRKSTQIKCKWTSFKSNLVLYQVQSSISPQFLYQVQFWT